MPSIYNIYCDESCHLEHDHLGVMVLGAVWCPKENAREIAQRIQKIKARHGLSDRFEIKWTKVSPAKQQFYLDIINFFFDSKNLHFRALIVPDKSRLQHDSFFGQSHDVFYYKMYFTMLKQILSPSEIYHIYLDIKDTRSREKTAKLHEVLCKSMYDFSRTIIGRVQVVHSHEVQQIQLADLLLGTVSYVNRELGQNRGKVGLVNRVKQRSGYSLQHSTLLKEEKFNLFRWRASEVSE
ncbi:DUF3800 domain-containing protein [Planctomycetota bacterium]